MQRVLSTLSLGRHRERYTIPGQVHVDGVKPVHIGVARIKLRLPENGTLKGKRQVVRSVTARVRDRFNVAIAEVEDNHLWQMLTLGVTCVSNDPRHANEMLSRVVDYIRGIQGDAELLDVETEVVSGV